MTLVGDSIVTNCLIRYLPRWKYPVRALSPHRCCQPCQVHIKYALHIYLHVYLQSGRLMRSWFLANSLHKQHATLDKNFLQAQVSVTLREIRLYAQRKWRKWIMDSLSRTLGSLLHLPNKEEWKWRKCLQTVFHPLQIFIYINCSTHTFFPRAETWLLWNHKLYKMVTNYTTQGQEETDLNFFKIIGTVIYVTCIAINVVILIVICGACNKRKIR